MKIRHPSFDGSRRRETAQRADVRASTALGGTRRSVACARKRSHERDERFSVSIVHQTQV